MKLHDLYSSRNINRVVTLKEDEMIMRRACMSEMKKANKTVFGKTGRKEQLGRHKTTLIGCSGNDM
jgi:hypothetical protein